MGNCLDTNKLADKPVTEKHAQQKQAKHQKIQESQNAIAKKIDMATKTLILNLNSSGLSELPASVVAIKNLKLLSLEGNTLTHLTSMFCTLKRLKTLNLSHNTLATLPVEFPQLEKLQELDLSFNELDMLPGLPSSLTKLTVANNRLKEVPECLRQCVKIVVLSLHNNQISGEIPDWICELTHLVSLNLNNNNLEGISEGVASTPMLEVLHLEHNKIASIPAVVLAKSKLHMMYLKGNAITKGDLMKTEGFTDFDERRKAFVNKGVAAGIAVETSLCGLD